MWKKHHDAPDLIDENIFTRLLNELDLNPPYIHPIPIINHRVLRENSSKSNSVITPSAFTLNPEEQLIIESYTTKNRNSHHEQGEIINDILGTYTPMHSPGKITLYYSNIKAFTKHAILKCNSYLPVTNQVAQYLVLFAVESVYIHEHFHLFSDITRATFKTNAPYDPLREEALAEAYTKIVFTQALDSYLCKYGKNRFPLAFGNHWTYFSNQIDRLYSFEPLGKALCDFKNYIKILSEYRNLISTPPIKGLKHLDGNPRNIIDVLISDLFLNNSTAGYKDYGKYLPYRQRFNKLNIDLFPCPLHFFTNTSLKIYEQNGINISSLLSSLLADIYNHKPIYEVK